MVALPRRTAIELLHLAAGVVVTAAMFRAAAWAYPPADADFRWVGGATLAAVMAMGVRPLRGAWRADHEERQ